MASVVDPEKMAQTMGSGFQFGTDPAGIAQQLRKLANSIERSEVAIQKAHVYHVVNHEDFKLSVVVLQVAEKAESSRQSPPSHSSDLGL